MPGKLSLLQYLCLACLLTACSSSSINTRYYQLSGTAIAPDGTSNTETGVKSVMLGPLHLPEYLDRSQVVMRISDTELDVSTEHRWAEPLQEGFLRLLEVEMNRQLQTMRVQAFNQRQHEQAGYRIILVVNRFDGSPDGEVRLHAQWTLIHQESGEVTDQRSVIYSASYNPRVHDYGAYISALSNLVSDLADDLSERVNALD